jgi:TatA/E family protein of Tat protein translocase
MFGEIGIEKLLLIFGIVLVIFGAKRLPEIGQGLGKGIREFKRATTGTPDAPSPGALEDERRSALEPREVLSLGDNNEDGPRRLIL